MVIPVTNMVWSTETTSKITTAKGMNCTIERMTWRSTRVRAVTSCSSQLR